MLHSQTELPRGAIHVDRDVVAASSVKRRLIEQRLVRVEERIAFASSSVVSRVRRMICVE